MDRRHTENQELERTVELVRSAQGGDAEALERLMTRYLPRVRQIVALRAGRRLKDFGDLEDIAQETVLRVFQGLRRIQQDSEGAFRNWVARCVECEIVDHIRKADAKKRGGVNVRRFGDFDGCDLHSSVLKGHDPTPSQVASAKELGERIEAALLAMPKHSREVIILRSLCDMSYAEIADEMGFQREVNARMAFSRAIQKLKMELGL